MSGPARYAIDKLPGLEFVLASEYEVEKATADLLAELLNRCSANEWFSVPIHVAQEISQALDAYDEHRAAR